MMPPPLKIFRRHAAIFAADAMPLLSLLLAAFAAMSAFRLLLLPAPFAAFIDADIFAIALISCLPYMPLILIFQPLFRR
jgi:hypothetical protein